MMNGFWLVFFIVLFTSSNPIHSEKKIKKEKYKAVEVHVSPVQDLYNQMNLSSILKFEAFEEAMFGYNSLPEAEKGILTVIDFTLPSTAKRMYVLDIVNKKVLFHNLVSHGRNSGDNYATSFSNKNNSHQSSLGFFMTENTYQGGNGYSLVLEGLEDGINDMAKQRAVVIHGAPYCSEKIIKSQGRLGRSYGCPALPQALAKPIINTIKDGTLLYIYANNKEYAQKSNILKKQEPILLAKRAISDHKVERIL